MPGDERRTLLEGFEGGDERFVARLDSREEAVVRRALLGRLPDAFDAVELGRVRRQPMQFDAVAVRYAVRVNGLDALALTKLDVLDGMDELQVCTAYRCGGSVLTEFPGEIAQLSVCEPIYESIEGWREPTKSVRRFSDLPRRAQAYIARLEALSGVPASILSTGSAREDTIVRDGSVAEGWGLQAVAG